MNFREIVHTIIDLGFLVIMAVLLLRVLGYQVGKREPEEPEQHEPAPTHYRVHDPEDDL